MLKTRQAQSDKAEARARIDTQRTRTFTEQTHAARAALDATQADIDGVKTHIADLLARKEAIETDITRENRTLQHLLPVAVRLSTSPDAALLAAPQTASDSVMALSVLGGFSQLTQQRAETLQSREDELLAVETDLETQRQHLATLEHQQTRTLNTASARTKLAAHAEAIASQQAALARKAVTEAAQAAADLNAKIDTLVKQEAEARTLLEQEAEALTRQHQKARARHARSQAQALSSQGDGVTSGHGHAPVSGHVSIAWGQATEAGPATGITYTTLSATSVQAPCAGRIEFAGPFRSFGQMLILDCGRNYRFVLSGMGALAVSGGQNVQKNATLGRMPAASGALFVQLRHGAQVVSPAPFL